MQERSEMKLGEAGTPAIYLRCLVSLLPPFLIHFRFPPTHLLSLLRCPIAYIGWGCRRCWLPSLPLFVACCLEGVLLVGCSV